MRADAGCGSGSSANASQSMPRSWTRPKSSQRAGASRPKLDKRAPAGASDITAASIRFNTATVPRARMRALARV